MGRIFRVVYLGVPAELTSMIDPLVVALREIPGVRVRVFSKRAVIARDTERRVAHNAPPELRDRWGESRERFDSLIWIRDLLNAINVSGRIGEEPLVAVVAECDEDPRIPPLMDVVFEGGLKDAVADVEEVLGRGER